MQCSICGAQLDEHAVVCEKCGALRITQRTPAGVIIGWIGMTVALLMCMMWLFLAALPFFDVNLAGFPWTTLFVGTAIATGLLWYSRTTRRITWMPRNK
jgi:predicted nucleic acid-binding Zn ribbon protein